MNDIEIQRKKTYGPKGEVEIFAIPAVSIQSPQGKKLIPNPHGNEAMVFATVDDAIAAIKRAGFDCIFEGKRISTHETAIPKSSGFLPLVAGPLSLQKAVPRLIERLGDRESAVVANTIFALGELHATEALPALIRILGHDDPNIRKNLAEAMAKIGEPALPVLQDTFSRSNISHEKLTILTAYLEIALHRKELLNQVLPQVLEALQDESWLVRSQAALVLGHAAAQLLGET